MPTFITKNGATYIRAVTSERHTDTIYLSGISSGVFADRPDASGLDVLDTGLLYAATDENKLYKWDGSTWELILG